MIGDGSGSEQELSIGGLLLGELSTQLGILNDTWLSLIETNRSDELSLLLRHALRRHVGLVGDGEPDKVWISDFAKDVVDAVHVEILYSLGTETWKMCRDGRVETTVAV